MIDKICHNVQERDVDLLLLEEFIVQPQFALWIAEQLNCTVKAFAQARHSVFANGGETDLLVEFETETGRLALMIEDKIGALMQPRQAERYRERGQFLVDTKEVSSYKTVLCAPERYLDSVSENDWDKKLSFETICDWFRRDAEPRSDWRLNVLTSATNRQRRASLKPSPNYTGYDERLFRFKKSYRTYVLENYKEIVISDQNKGKDKEYFFTSRYFPVDVGFKHDFDSAMILIFRRGWKGRAERTLPATLPDGMWTKVHPNELHLKTGTEPIDWTAPAEQQLDLIDAAFSAAQRLMPYADLVRNAE